MFKQKQSESFPPGQTFNILCMLCSFFEKCHAVLTKAGFMLVSLALTRLTVTSCITSLFFSGGFMSELHMVAGFVTTIMKLIAYGIPRSIENAPDWS